MVLKALYRTKYPDQDALSTGSDGSLPRKTHMTSHLSPEEVQWLAQSVGGPAHFMAATGGFGAGCLMHCEMYGLGAYQVTAMTDSHSVTVESMQAYGPVLAKLGLPSNVDAIYERPTFRQTLKEVN